MNEYFNAKALRDWRRLKAGIAPSDMEAVALDDAARLESSHVHDAREDGAATLKAYRSRLIADHQLSSAYIGVSQLARILGLSPSAIHNHMRAGRFFLPYRLFNAAPKVFIDDLVEWHCSGQGVVPAFGDKPCRDIARGLEGEELGLTTSQINQAVERAADDALRAAGIDPAKRRRPVAKAPHAARAR